jgi:hypothetical protein
MQNSKATCQAPARQHTRQHITRQPRQRNSTGTRQLDSYSTRRRMALESALTGSTGTRQARQGSTGKASTAPRQRARQRLDGASTARASTARHGQGSSQFWKEIGVHPAHDPAKPSTSIHLRHRTEQRKFVGVCIHPPVITTSVPMLNCSSTRSQTLHISHSWCMAKSWRSLSIHAHDHALGMHSRRPLHSIAFAIF